MASTLGIWNYQLIINFYGIVILYFNFFFPEEGGVRRRIALFPSLLYEGGIGKLENSPLMDGPGFGTLVLVSMWIVARPSSQHMRISRISVALPLG